MAKLRDSSTLGFDRSRISKVSLTSKKCKLSASNVSEYGSMFGRSVAKFPRNNDPGLMRTLSVTNSRIIPAIFNPTLQHNSSLPNLGKIEGTHCIRQLGKSLNITDYEFNCASFWVLDVLSKKIQDLQIRKIDKINQNKFLSWFRFILHGIAVSAFSREDMFGTLKKIFQYAVTMINDEKSIPDPKEVEIGDSGKIDVSLLTERTSLNSLHISNSFKSRKRFSSTQSLQRSLSVLSKLSENSSKRSTASPKDSEESRITEEQIKKNVEYFQTMVEMMYQIFADRFVYTLILKAFSSPVTVTPVDIEVKFQDPKQLRPESGVELPATVISPKRDRNASKIRKKSKGKGKKKKSTFEDGKDNVHKSKKKTKKSRSRKEKNGEKETLNKKVKQEQSKEMNKPLENQQEITNSINQKKNINIENEMNKKTKKHTTKENTQVKQVENNDKISRKRKELKKPVENLKKIKRTKSRGKIDVIIDKKFINKMKNRKDEDNDKEVEQSDKIVGKRIYSPSSPERKKVIKDKRKSKNKKSSQRDRNISKSLSAVDVLRNARHVSLEDKIKLFDHDIAKELELELENLKTKNKFILPLSEAVGTNYVANILKIVMPQESKPVKNLEADSTNKQTKDVKKAKKKSLEKRRKETKKLKKK